MKYETDISDFIQSLKESLKVVYFTGRGNRRCLTIRCPYCGDSRKHAFKGHLNIRLSDPEALVWRCVRCEASGAVTPKFIKDIQVDNIDLLNFAYKNSVNVANKKQKRQAYIDKKKFFLTPKGVNADKLSYLEERLFTDLTPIDWIKNYKVIFSLNNFLSKNKLDAYNLSEDFQKRLNSEYVGFLSFDKSTIVFRNIYNENPRYYNYHIIDDEFTSSPAYMIPAVINRLKPSINVYLAEGVFDIISLHLWHKESFNCQEPNIFMATAGRNCYNALLTLIDRGIIDIKLTIFRDSDTDLNFFKRNLKSETLFKTDIINVYKNVLAKDFAEKEIKLELANI